MTGVWADLARTLRSSVHYRRLRDEQGDVLRLPLGAAAWVRRAARRRARAAATRRRPHEADALAWIEAARLVASEERSLYAKTEARVRQLGERNWRLEKDPVTLGRLARQELGLVKPDDLVVVFPAPAGLSFGQRRRRDRLVRPSPENRGACALIAQ